MGKVLPLLLRLLQDNFIRCDWFARSEYHQMLVFAVTSTIFRHSYSWILFKIPALLKKAFLGAFPMSNFIGLNFTSLCMCLKSNCSHTVFQLNSLRFVPDNIIILLSFLLMLCSSTLHLFETYFCINVSHLWKVRQFCDGYGIICLRTLLYNHEKSDSIRLKIKLL